MAKEKLFASPKTQSAPITLLGKGTKLIGGTIKSELTRDDLDQVLVKEFFPEIASSELPARQRRVGFQELGLPYAADAAVANISRGFCQNKFATAPRRRPSGAVAAAWRARRASSSTAE